jgi:hypothetical protein
MTNPASLIESRPPPPVTSRLPLSRIARNGMWISVLALATYYALFRLPFRFPPRQRLMSASYAFGFNNSVAILALTGLLGLLTLYLLGRGKANELPIVFPRQRAVESQWSASMAFVIVVLCYAVLTFAMYIYNVRVAPPIMWETRHLLHRTWLMDLYGLHPYTEVAAEYGPILTYAPSWMYWLLKPLGASHELAYFASHFLLNVAGLWCSYYVLTRAIMPERARLVSFAILGVAGFAPYMGINGVLMRYLFPFAALLLGRRAINRSFSWENRIASWAGATVSVLLFLIANILLSPETGVAFALAWLGYAVLSLHSEFRVLVASLVALVVAALLCWLFLPVAYYGTLLRFSEGANNLPLLPAAHLLLYILTLFLLVPPLLAVSVRRWRTADESGAAICGALGILCIVMAPGALGRCDPPHALLFGMGVSMLLMIRLANVSWRTFVIYATAYAAVFIVFIEAVNLLVFYGISPKSVLSRHLLTNLSQRFRYASDTTHPDAAMLSALEKYPHLGLPYASFGDPAVEKYVITSGKLDPEYYVAIVGVYSSAALQRKLQDVGQAEYLLLPFDPTADSAPSKPCEGYLKSLRRWFLLPAKLPCRADPLEPAASLNSFIAEHYKPVEKVGSWWVLRKVRNGPTTKSRPMRPAAGNRA